MFPAIPLMTSCLFDPILSMTSKFESGGGGLFTLVYYNYYWENAEFEIVPVRSLGGIPQVPQ